VWAVHPRNTKTNYTQDRATYPVDAIDAVRKRTPNATVAEDQFFSSAAATPASSGFPGPNDVA
jgi:hypothetical protein